MFYSGQKIRCISKDRQTSPELNIGQIYTVKYEQPNQPNYVWVINGHCGYFTYRFEPVIKRRIINDF